MKTLLSTLLILLPLFSMASTHQHEVGLFIGNTALNDENISTYGLDYEYRFSQMDHKLGALIFAESFEEHGEETRIYGAGVAYHPLEHLRLILALGNESNSHHQANLARIGASYGFSITENFLIAPTVNLDLTEEDSAIVYGATLAVGF